ncbi:MAG TPA: hypothetical protein GX519_02830 [Thermoanaerobacterales bacterium]|nr:hypothetical protein [Thermoanaerobacterales bacterium]
MKLVVTFDIGTTAVKGVLVSSDGKIVFSKSIDINTKFDKNFKEQDPDDWYNSFCEISKEILNLGINKEDILGIIMSGQMQDLILVDKNGDSIDNAILYSDGRASKEAKFISNLIGKEEIIKSTGNNFDGTMPFAKLLWLKNNRPNIYNKINRILISSKDYCIAKLTGEYATDLTSASTSGMMDIRTKKFNTSWLNRANINPGLLPNLYCPAEVVGEVTEKASQESGYNAGTKVYAGIGDAGATTLASEIKYNGEVNINLGTSGWVATINDDVVKGYGVFNLVAADRDLYINVVPFLNAGNVHNWIASIFAIDGNINRYAYIKNLLKNRSPGSNNLIFLPYIVGERFPVMDNNIKGCYYGITPETKKEDMISAALEGVAFSIKQGLEEVSEESKKITLIGGGAKEEHWCQMLSDILGKELIVFTNTEFLPAIAIAGLVFGSSGEVNKNNETKYYYPEKNNAKLYNKLYKDFKELYPRLKGMTEDASMVVK